MGLFDGTPLERPILCDRCGLPDRECTCPPPEVPDVAPESQALKLQVEKRKRGKIVTVVRGFECQPTQLARVLTNLKQLCGAGGTVDEMAVEIQGDHAARIAERLKELGYQIRK